MTKNRGVVVNTGIIYVTRVLQMVFPLIILPFIARKLPVESYGAIVTAQAAATLIGTIVEYGFNYTGARDLAKAIDNKQEFDSVFNLIHSSKVMLFFLSLFIILIYIFFNKNIGGLGIFIVMLVFAQGFSPYWAFQAVGFIIPYAVMEFLARFLTFISVIYLIKTEISVYSFMFTNSIFSLLSSVALILYFIKIYKINVGFYNPLKYLKSSFNMFVFRLGAIAYSSGSMALLGVVVPAAQVAIYGGADRFFRAISMLIGPIGEVIFPRISYLRESDVRKAKVYQIYGFIVLALLSFSLAIALFFTSSLIVNHFLGDKYFMSIDILKILSLNVFLIGIGTAIGVIYIIPRKLDNIFATATVIAGTWNLFSIFFLVPKLGLNWMAWSINISECLLILTCTLFLIFRRRNA